MLFASFVTALTSVFTPAGTSVFVRSTFATVLSVAVNTAVESAYTTEYSFASVIPVNVSIT